MNKNINMDIQLGKHCMFCSHVSPNNDARIPINFNSDHNKLTTDDTTVSFYSVTLQANSHVHVSYRASWHRSWTTAWKNSEEAGKW